jgi:hypothetical protein
VEPGSDRPAYVPVRPPGCGRPRRREYRRLEAELPGLPVTWSGSLSWGAEDGAPEAGPGQEIVDAATVVTLEPTLRGPPECPYGHPVTAPSTRWA